MKLSQTVTIGQKTRVQKLTTFLESKGFKCYKAFDIIPGIEINFIHN